MADFGEEQLKRISFHLLTFQNPRARQHVLRNRVKIADFFRLEPRELQLTGLFPEEIKAVRERNWAAAEVGSGAAEKKQYRDHFQRRRGFPAAAGRNL